MPISFASSDISIYRSICPDQSERAALQRYQQWSALDFIWPAAGRHWASAIMMPPFVFASIPACYLWRARFPACLARLAKRLRARHQPAGYLAPYPSAWWPGAGTGARCIAVWASGRAPPPSGILHFIGPRVASRRPSARLDEAGEQLGAGRCRISAPARGRLFT